MRKTLKVMSGDETMPAYSPDGPLGELVNLLVEHIGADPDVDPTLAKITVELQPGEDVVMTVEYDDGKPE